MTAEFAAGVLEHAADTQLAALREISANLAAYAERRANEIAAPVIAEAERTAAAAREDLERAHAGFDQRLSDLQTEFGRRDAARDRMVRRLQSELEQARAASACSDRQTGLHSDGG